MKTRNFCFYQLFLKIIFDPLILAKKLVFFKIFNIRPIRHFRKKKTHENKSCWKLNFTFYTCLTHLYTLCSL